MDTPARQSEIEPVQNILLAGGDKDYARKDDVEGRNEDGGAIAWTGRWSELLVTGQRRVVYAGDSSESLSAWLDGRWKQEV